MNKDNKKTKVDNTDKKLDISGARKSLCHHNWTYRTFG